MGTAMAILSVLGTGCSKIKMARHEQRADKYFATGDFPRAEIEYLNTLRISHTNAHAIARLGIIYFKEGCLGRAYPFITKACEFYPNDLDLRIKLGTIDLGARKLKDARDVATFVLSKSPTNSEAPLLLVESISSAREKDQVQKQLETLSGQIGQTAPLQLAFGELSLRAGDFKAAEAAYKRAQELDPKSSSAYFALGNLYAAQNKLKEADEALKNAADLAEVRSIERLGYATFKITHGDLAEGKHLLDEITKAAPDFVPAWIHEAQIAFNEKKYDDCQKLLERALAHDPNNYDALLLQGEMSMAQNRTDSAIATFERMAGQYHQSAQVQFYLGLAHLIHHDIAQAINSLNQALAIDPNYPDAIVTLAGLNVEKRNFAPAIASLAELVRRQPQLYQPRMLLAEAYLKQDNPDEALAVYSQAELSFPKDPQIPFLAGTVLFQQNKLADARDSFERALQLAPHSPPIEEQLVNLDIAEKKFPAAFSRVNSELQLNTNSVALQLLLAKIHVARATDAARSANPDASQPNFAGVTAAREDIDQAEAELQTAINLKPNLPTAYLLLAQLYVASGKEQTALSRLAEIAQKTNSAPVFMEMGMIYDTLTNYPAARDAYEKVLAIDPDFSPALNNLAYLYSERLGQTDKAYSLAEKARRLLPYDPATADTLGWILYRRGEYDRALGLLEESAGKLIGQPEVQYHLGMTYYMLGDETAARATLQRAAKSPRDFSGKHEISRRLAILNTDANTTDPKTISDLENSIRNEPDDPIAAGRLAAIYERQGTLEKAATTYEHVLKANPQNAQIMGRLAQLYLQLNKTDRAMELAKQAHDIAPEDAAISWTLGRLVYQTGDYAWALSLLQQSADKLSSQGDVLYDLAWSYYSMGAVQNAETSMQKAVPSLSGGMLADARCFLAMVAAARTAPDPKDVAEANQVLSTNASYVPAIMVVAIQQDQQGKYDDARKLYEKALAHFPAFALAARNLAILDAQHPDNDQNAFQLGMKARAAFPDDPKLAGALGILAYRSGDYTQSAQLLMQGAEGPAQDGELLYYLGKAQYQLKQNKKSKDALQRALALNIRPELADDARKLLAQLKQN